MDINRDTRTFSAVSLTVYLAFITGPIVVALLVLHPGLGGPFLLDDYPNLAGLGGISDTQPVIDSLWYLFNGMSGPTGRPISLASFLLNSDSWPNYPRDFLYINLMLHILNGILIFWLTYKLISLIDLPVTTLLWISSITSLVWMIHPLQISTVFYTVQRMTILSTLFTLGGLIFYIYFRTHQHGYSWQRHIFILTPLIYIFAAAASLSKENGVLIFFYLCTIELIYFKFVAVSTPKLPRYWFISFVALPAALISIYILYLSTLPGAYLSRSFSLSERTITEGRVLTEYIRHIIFPNLSGLGVYHDDFVISKSLFEPLSTFPSVIFISGLLLAGFLLRKSYPMLSFSILWFFSGHILESTTLPLEPYFEHRNYLSMYGILLFITSVIIGSKHVWPNFSKIAIPCYLLLLSFLSYSQTTLWSKHENLLALWLIEHPNSLRALDTARLYARDSTPPRVDEYKKYTSDLYTKHKRNSYAILSYIEYICISQSTDKRLLDKLIQDAAQSEFFPASLNQIRVLNDLVANERCLVLQTAEMALLLKNLINNPAFDKYNSLSDLHYSMAMVKYKSGDLALTITHLDYAYAYKPNIDIRLTQAAFLYEGGLHKDALLSIEDARQHSNTVQLALKRNVIDEIEAIILATMPDEKPSRQP